MKLYFHQISMKILPWIHILLRKNWCRMKVKLTQILRIISTLKQKMLKQHRVSVWIKLVFIVDFLWKIYRFNMTFPWNFWCCEMSMEIPPSIYMLKRRNPQLFHFEIPQIKITISTYFYFNAKIILIICDISTWNLCEFHHYII